MTRGLSRRQLVLALAAALAGCGETPPTRLFTLAARPGAKHSPPPGAILVKQVAAAKYLDRPQIVRHGTPYELKVLDLERWGEGFADMTTRVLVEDLALRLPGAEIFAADAVAGVPPAATVEVDVDRFDGDAGGPVVLAAQWSVRRERTAPRLHAERIEAMPSSGDIVALVEAMSAALGELADRIAAALSG